MPRRTVLTALAVFVTLAGHTVAADTRPVAVAYVLIARWTPNDHAPAADPAHPGVVEDYLASHMELLRSTEIATRAALSKKLQGVRAVSAADIVRAIKVERQTTGIKDSLTLTAVGVPPDVGVAVLDAVLETYQDYLREIYKVPQPGQPNRGGFSAAVLAKPFLVKN
jgi:hypothetical protein